jgi:hypothetical protein
VTTGRQRGRGARFPRALAALAVLLPSALAVSGGSGGRPLASAHVGGPPPARTGGFGEPTCRECHTGFELNASGGGLTVEGLPPAYDPGVPYVLTIVLRSTDMGRAGFQLSVRDERGRQAGQLSGLGARVSLSTEGGISFAHHTAVGSAVSDGEMTSWAVEWTAPESAGPVWMHLAANSANGDDSPLGDFIYARAVSLRAR